MIDTAPNDGRTGDIDDDNNLPIIQNYQSYNTRKHFTE